MNSVAILIGVCVIAIAIAFSGRFEMVPSSGNAAYAESFVWRLDRWTGTMWLCANYHPSGGALTCYKASD